MDRFIDTISTQELAENIYLKSNMDRFIASGAVVRIALITYLKSNMDRFIDINNSFCNIITHI